MSAFGAEIRKNNEPLPIRISPELEKRADLFFQHEALEDARSFMALAPGGGRSWGPNALYKQWEPEKFAQTANAWCAETKQALLLVGDESEKGLLETVRKSLTATNKIICGQSLGVVAALLKRVRILLGNDGGLIHLAHALGVRTVSIFGPVDETVYGAYAQGTHIVLTEHVPCRPCYANFHFPPCPYERRCLDHLAVDKAVDALGEILLYSKTFKG